MDERAFIEQKQDSWKIFSESLDKVRKRGVGSLSNDQITSLGAQYRALISDLSFARSQGASDRLVIYLNELAGRGHGVVYASRPAKAGGIITFLLKDFPCLYRETFPYTLAAALIFLIGCGAGLWLVHKGFNTGGWLFPKGIDAPQMSSKIMTNNIKVTILAFAAGITAGILTIYVLFSNGAMLAAVAASQDAAHKAQLLTFVLPHGVIELNAIFIAGGAGLIIGSAIIAPGNLRRADAVQLAAAKALRLFAGTIPMLIIAGTIEGFVSPSGLPRWSKFMVSALTAVALVLYFGFVGKGKAENTDNQKITISPGS